MPTEKFVIIPHELIKDRRLNPTDKVVYACTRSFVENDSPKPHQSFITIPDKLISDKDLTNRDKTVYMTLKTYMNNGTKKCFPSRKTIAESEGTGLRTITSSVSRLENNGYIKRNFRYNGSTIYEFLE